MSSPVKPRRWIGLLLLAVAAWCAALPVAAQEAEVVAETVVTSEEESVRAEVDRLFRVLRLRNGVLLEPREDMDGVAAIEISDGTFVIDGQPISPSGLDARLGAAAQVVRRLGELESRGRPDTFGGGRPPRSRPAPPTAVEAPAPPAPRAPRRPARMRNDSQVVVGSSVTIEADEESRDVVVFGGRLTVLGTVIGDAVAIGGSVVIEPGAEVTGDVASIGGPTTVRGGTTIGGDAISVGNEVEIDDTASLAGRVVEVPFGPQVSFGWPDSDNWDWDWDDDWWDSSRRGWWGFGRVFNLFWSFFGLLFLALLACLAYLLAKGPVERMRAKVRTEPWKAGLVGLVAQLLFLPLLALVSLILLISIIGIPLLALVPFAILGVVLVSFLGYTSVALNVGRWSEERFGWNMVNPYVAIVVGVGLVQVISFVGDILDLLPGPLWFFAIMFGAFGAIIKYVAWTTGLGAALLTRFGTLDDGTAVVAGALPPLPPPDSPDGDWEDPAEPGALPDLDWEPSSDGEGEPESVDTDDEPWEPEVEPEAEPASEPAAEPAADPADGDGKSEPK